MTIPVIVKKYYDKIAVYSNNTKVCEHLRLDGCKQMKVDIYHYLNTLQKKPGAIRNSLALKSIPSLKNIFDKYYTQNPRKFIEIFMDHKHLNIEEIIKVLEDKQNIILELSIFLQSENTLNFNTEDSQAYF